MFNKSITVYVVTVTTNLCFIFNESMMETIGKVINGFLHSKLVNH